jgi:hypothetical protein
MKKPFFLSEDACMSVSEHSPQILASETSITWILRSLKSVTVAILHCSFTSIKSISF